MCIYNPLDEFQFITPVPAGVNIGETIKFPACARLRPGGVVCARLFPLAISKHAFTSPHLHLQPLNRPNISARSPSRPVVFGEESSAPDREK